MRVFCFDMNCTLYKEINYLMSAYRKIAEYAAKQRIEEVMLPKRWIENIGEVFSTK